MEKQRKKLSSTIALRLLACSAILLSLTLVQPANAAFQFQTDADCQNCLGAGSIVCRPSFYDRYSFCCDETEVGSLTCGGRDVFCTSQAATTAMKTFSCPYSYGYCGAKTSELEMHPTRRNNLKLEIQNRLFVDSETCYYTFFAPTSSLDTDNMRYFYDVEVLNMTNVDMLISNGSSYETANDTVKVSFSTGYRFQYTAENNKIFVSFTGNVPTYSKTKPLFAVAVKLRSFELNPAKPDVPDETPEDKDPEKPLIDEEKDQVNDTEDQEPIIVTETEIITIRKPVTIREAAERKVRKKQTGLTILTAVVTLAIVIYIATCLCSEASKKRHRQAQIKSMRSFTNVEMTRAGPGTGSPGANNQNSEQLGLMESQIQGQEDFDGQKFNARRMKINEAIEETDQGKKGQGVAKKGKKKKKNAKGKDQDDDNMLSINQNEVHRADSWDSSRGHAQDYDVSGRHASNANQSNMGGMSRTTPHDNPGGQYYNQQTQGMMSNSHSQHASAQQLSVEDQLASIEEARDLSARGGLPAIQTQNPGYQGGFSSAASLEVPSHTGGPHNNGAHTSGHYNEQRQDVTGGGSSRGAHTYNQSLRH